MRAWMETETIEKALDRHTCNIEREFMYHGREFLFKCVFHGPPFYENYLRGSPLIGSETVPGCASLMNFRDTFPMCEFIISDP
jgi:hypothetical protein